jgi:hypothetical protein
MGHWRRGDVLGCDLGSDAVAQNLLRNLHNLLCSNDFTLRFERNWAIKSVFISHCGRVSYDIFGLFVRNFCLVCVEKNFCFALDFVPLHRRIIPCQSDSSDGYKRVLSRDEH